MASIGREIGLMLGAAFVIGFFVIGAQFLLYGLAPTMYPSLVRGTGVGWGVAVGRLGSIVGPAVAAGILASGRGASDVMLAMLPVIAIAFVAIFILTWRTSTTEDAS
jgi:AAHS family 3-hydroxyphenylpropionic acid transporter